MILGEGDTLLMEHLPLDVLGQAQSPDGLAKGFRIPPEGISMEKLEETLVRQALDMTARNQTRAAKLLDISRDSLRYRMQKFGINADA
jgi:DNA-binding NtrC family response regulator